MRFIVLVASLLTACGSSSKPVRSGTASGGGPTVAVEHVAGLGDPVLEIHNVTDRPAQVTFVGATQVSMDLPAMSSKSAKLPPGSYSARVSGGDAGTAEWPMTVDADHRYRVTLKLVPEFDMPQYVGKGMYCYEVTTTHNYLLCSRTMERCSKRKAETPATMKTSTCAFESQMFGFRAENGTGGVFLPFLRTQTECDELRARVLQQEKPAVLSACAVAR